MPTRRPQYCKAPGCPTLVKRGFCPPCLSKARAQSDEGRTDRQFYSTKRWRAVRKKQLIDHPFCQCKDKDDRPCGKLANVVDHIIPMSQGGEHYDANNLQSFYKPCHDRKTALEQGRFASKKETA